MLIDLSNQKIKDEGEKKREKNKVEKDDNEANPQQRNARTWKKRRVRKSKETCVNKTEKDQRKNAQKSKEIERNTKRGQQFLGKKKRTTNPQKREKQSMQKSTHAPGETQMQRWDITRRKKRRTKEWMRRRNATLKRQ